jgi:hydroxymethylpyrimidine pyrophosphatase-like HAD family hydrolase
MSFGDGMNDLTMIEAAGVGVAMSNACQEVLDAADYITLSNDEDGVAAALRHFNLPEGKGI